MENIIRYIAGLAVGMSLILGINEFISGNRDSKYEMEYQQAKNKLDSLAIKRAEDKIAREYIIRDLQMYKGLYTQSKQKLARYNQAHTDGLNYQEEILREATAEEFDSLQNEYFNNLPEE